MSAPQLIEAAAADGLHISLGASGKLKLIGTADAVNRWRERIAARKPDILTALRDTDPAPSNAYALAADRLESIIERAAIIEANGVPRDESEAMAVRLVQCRGCRHFTAAASSPLAGIGTCSAGGWPQGGNERPGGSDGLLCRLAEPQNSPCISGETAG